VAVVTIDNAAKLNTLNTPLMTDLIAEGERLANDEALRAVVLRGAGERAFVGGADIDEMAGFDGVAARRFITLVHRSCEVFRRLPVPVIARIQGYALGAGVELAAACDMRIAGSGAQFAMPEVRLGIPSVVEAALLPQLIGWGRTRRWLLTADAIDAPTAQSWGLIDDIAPPEQLDATIEQRLEQILAAGPRAVRLQKSLISRWEELPLAQAVERGIDCFALAWQVDEPRRMMQDFLNRRRERRLGAGRNQPL
jgi:enoyl-CoA hydratase/carnithine racemase